MSIKHVFHGKNKVTAQIAPIWDKWLERPSDHVSTRFRFKPSGISGCRRKLFYEFILAEKDPGGIAAKTMRIFDMGHAVHDILQKQLLACGVIEKPEDIEVEFFTKKGRIKGFIDAIITIKGERYILEIKSINTKGFDGLKGPKEDHIDQANVYMKVMKISKAIILYYDKNTSRTKEFYIEMDIEVILSLKQRMDYVKQCVETGAVPKRISKDPKSYFCMFCDYKKACHSKKRLDWEEIQKAWEEVKNVGR